MIDEHALIDLVKSHQALYNRNHPDYVNQQLRDSIWKEIADKLGDNGVVCKEKWSRIRENFRKAILLRKQKTDSGMKYNRPPKYYFSLKFLLPFLKDDSGQPQDSEDANGEDDVDFSDSSISNPVPRKTMKRIISVSELSLEANEEASAEPTEELMVFNPQPNKSECDNILKEFFENMANTVAKFPLRKQLEIKHKLFNMVHDVEVEMAENGRDVLF